MSKKYEILEKAIELFVNQGIENTPTSQISREADVATGTLFHHFSTKEELVNEAYLYVMRKSMVDLKNSETDDLREYLKTMWFSGMDWALGNKKYVQFMFTFANSTYILPDTFVNANEILRPFFNIIKDWNKHKDIKKFPNDILLNLYNRIFETYFNYLMNMDEPDSDLINQGFNVVWDAIKAH